MRSIDTLCAYLVHVYTASGVVFAFLAAAETCSERPDPRWVFLWVAIAAVIDATDGPLARRYQVKQYARRIDGRTIDDIVDYLTYTFIPLLLVWRMEWLSPPTGLWVASAMLASIFGFANAGAKEEKGGFFLGFPSYWNVVAYYIGFQVVRELEPLLTAIVVILAFSTVLPLRFVYPNHAPRKWRKFLVYGGVIWLGSVLALLPGYPRASAWWVGGTLAYPALYLGLSIYLDRQERRERSGA